MSDCAFRSAPFNDYTTDELQSFVDSDCLTLHEIAPILDELYRRDLVAAGDKSVMTPDELLRYHVSCAIERGEDVAIAGITS